MAGDPTSVLFVCLGNICRSPAAEAVFRAKVEAAGLTHAFRIDSAGILNYHKGNKADKRMRKHGTKRGVDITSISRPVVSSDFDKFDVIVAMDFQNQSDLHTQAPNKEARERVVMMCSYCNRHDEDEVPDPYYGGPQGFETVLDMLDDACDGLLSQIRPCANE